MRFLEGKEVIKSFELFLRGGSTLMEKRNLFGKTWACYFKDILINSMFLEYWGISNIALDFRRIVGKCFCGKFSVFILNKVINFTI